jgi:hypothetical protein
MSHKLENVMSILLNDTVFEKWFSPMNMALQKVRYSDKAYSSLPIGEFIILGCLRQLLSINTLREQIQHLFHLDDAAAAPPVARSTWSDALASNKRLVILRQAMQQLIAINADRLPDRYANIPSLKGRPVYAMDVTYQTESMHYYPIYPSDGGSDNQKGHLLLHTYDMRRAIPVDVGVDTESIGEMRFVKEQWETAYWSKQKNALYVVDRAFVDFYYWDTRKKDVKATVISRMKSTYKYEVTRTKTVSRSTENEGVLEDIEISPNSSKHTWRLIRFKAPDSKIYEYLTNDLILEPGIIAFMYYRRWDEEKYFDAFKNDMASNKAWSKSKVGIEQQAILGMATYLLTRLFLVDTSQALNLDEDKKLQEYKHDKKIDQYLEWSEEISLRAFYRETSKITKQAWRFLKNSFIKQSSPGLYERQLRPLLEGYL